MSLCSKIIAIITNNLCPGPSRSEVVQQLIESIIYDSQTPKNLLTLK